MGNNIFYLLKIENKENFHSRFITAIIESDENAKKKFLEMLERVSGKDFLSSGACGKFKFKNEKNLSEKNGRADIYITDFETKNTKNTRIIIENKIYAGDQREQLFRYKKHLKDNNYNNYALFYLTLGGKPATNYSKECFKTNEFLSENKDYFLLSYNKDIKGWLKDIMNPEMADSRLQSYVKDYLEIVSKITHEWCELENDYNANKNAETPKEKTYLELKLWNYFENHIFIREQKEIVGLSNKRLFNYEKALQCQSKKSEQRDYGIIFKLFNNVEIRIGVKAQGEDKFQIFISKGKMNPKNNQWESESKHPLEYKTNELHNRMKMEEIATKIILELQNHYQFPNKIED